MTDHPQETPRTSSLHSDCEQNDATIYSDFANMTNLARQLERELSRVAELERAAPQDDPNFKIQAATQVPGYYSAAGVEEPRAGCPKEYEHIPCWKYADLWEMHIAPGGDGEYAYEWSDKPHRALYRLTQIATEQRDELRTLRALLEASLQREREALAAVKDAGNSPWKNRIEFDTWRKQHAAVIQRSREERGE